MQVNFHHGVQVNPVVIAVSVTDFYVPSFLVERDGGNEILSLRRNKKD